MASNCSVRRRANLELSTFFTTILDENRSTQVNDTTRNTQIDSDDLFPIDFSISDVCYDNNENSLNSLDSDLYLNEEDFEQNKDSSDSQTSEPKEDLKENILTIADYLLMFFITFNISHCAMLYLLKLLIKFSVPDVPNSIYLLTKKSQFKSTDIIKLAKGNFFHFSIIENLKYCIDKGISNVSSTIDFIFNVDGLPLFKSSGLCAWPILLYIPQFKSKFPLPVSIYCGTVKPDLCTLITDLCGELSILKSQGFVY
ncbi:uncharacterized protein LOC136095984 [Hydra vulgaris]|uniref:uncharacterized protein LOC136095984 n=1 Tax=Hydra vulgaris TaxID=6087 RepID=UPI0032EA6BC3